MVREIQAAEPEPRAYRACCIDLAVAVEAADSRALRYARVLHLLTGRGAPPGKPLPAKRLEEAITAARALMEEEQYADRHGRGARVLDYLRNGG